MFNRKFLVFIKSGAGESVYFAVYIYLFIYYKVNELML
jgi:hypothetical protein